ncbi:MAG: helix-turn-helix domain-containing protein, partial [Desulfobacteraceae bacterium]
GVSPRAMDALLRYDWPGNVRELMNVIERAVVLSRSEYVDQADLPMTGMGKGPSENAQPRDEEPYRHVSLEEVEKAAILKTMEETAGNKSEAARRLGVTRKTLHKKLKKYGPAEQ